MALSKDLNSPATVHVLISEEFFWEKVESVLQALHCRPKVPDWERDAFEQIAAERAVALVADLEADKIEILPLLHHLRRDPRTADLPMLAYCSHNRLDLIRPAQALGAKVVTRSTFAANLVRVLMDLVRRDSNSAEGG